MFEMLLLLSYRALYFPLAFVCEFVRWRQKLGRPKFEIQSQNRWGYYDDTQSHKRPCIWIHAVSVGEVKLAIRLIEKWSTSYDHSFFISVTTTTAYQILCQTYSKQASHISYGFFPYDQVKSCRRAFKCINPSMIVLLESDLWPIFLCEAKRLKVPVWLVNARMSKRSYEWLSKYPSIAKLLYGRLSGILASCKITVSQLTSLPCSIQYLSYEGALKTDIPAGKRLKHEAKIKNLKNLGLRVSSDTKVLLGVSTWPGEEAMLVHVTEALRQSGEDVVLICVPRHAERRQALIELFEESGLPWQQRTNFNPQVDQAVMYLADTTGELSTFLALADVAFVGKSSHGHVGGQNPIEPISYGLPTIMGPEYSNFVAIVQSMLEQSAITVSENNEAIMAALLTHLREQDKCDQMSRQARRWLKQRQGVYEAVVRQLQQAINISEKHTLTNSELQG